MFPEVARFIARINLIPFPEGVLSFRERVTGYLRHKDTWRIRLDAILLSRETEGWARKIEKLMPRAEAMLDRFEEKLTDVKPVFVFESAHLGHCMRVRSGFRFLNWEQVSFGDPAFTLGVFLASFIERPNFEVIKSTMIAEYCKANPVSHFAELVENRLCEWEISNLLWVPWAHIKRQSSNAGQAPDLSLRFRRVERLLMEFPDKG